MKSVRNLACLLALLVFPAAGWSQFEDLEDALNSVEDSLDAAEEAMENAAEPWSQGGGLHTWPTGMNPGRAERTIQAPTENALTLKYPEHILISGLDKESFELTTKGSGDVYLEGRADTLEIDARGSGDIDASRVQANSIRVRLAGSGKIRVHTSGELTVRVQGSGTVFYSGHPSSLRKKVMGSGALVELPEPAPEKE